jgi:hypothetical protein
MGPKMNPWTVSTVITKKCEYSFLIRIAKCRKNIIPLRAKRVGEFIKNFTHPYREWKWCDSVTL